LQTYQRESKPIQDVYAQVTQLFHTAPDLLEDFKQFLPESAAQAKAQAAARAAADEAMISNVRGDYAAGQISQAQTPRPTTKMPPMGQFDPPSTSKENKKRRGGLGILSSQAGPPSSLDAIGPGPGGRGGTVQMGNVNKVSECSFAP
jgi:paired amphipathic helix protein Sin3a